MIDAIFNSYKHGRLIPVLGAGCSLQAINRDGNALPTGQVLSEYLCTEFDIDYDSEPLSEIIQACLCDHDSAIIYDFIVRQLSVNNPGPEYTRLSEFVFPRIYTLNIDDALDRAFRADASTRCKVIYRDAPIQTIDPTLQDTQIIKLHGCVDRQDLGFIFSMNDYESAHSTLPIWYDELAADCLNTTTVFIGTEANEPLLFDAIKRMDSSATPQNTFVILPSISNTKLKILTSKGIKFLEGTFSGFLDFLQSKGACKLTRTEIAKKREPALAYILDQTAVDAKKEAIKVLQDVKPILAASSATPEEIPAGIRSFYEGFRATDSDIRDLVPAKLHFIHELVELALNCDQRLLVVTGPSGAGKNTALKMVAKELSTQQTKPVLFLHSDAKDPLTLLRFLEEIYSDGYYLLIDSLYDFRHNINTALDQNVLNAGKIITAEPLNTWEAFLKDEFHDEEFCEYTISEISRDDAQLILEKVEKFGPWTRLSRLSLKERVNQIYDKARKQLLIGLLEATQGRGFQEIIKSDYQSLKDDPSRNLLAMVALCSIHGQGIPLDAAIRAFTIENDRTKFSTALKLLEGMVKLKENFLVARHPLYARHLFGSVVDYSDRKSAIISTLKAFAAYGSPVPLNTNRAKSKVFKGVLNYRFLSSAFDHDAENVIEVYKNFETIFHSDGAYWLQYGLALRRFSKHVEALKILKRSVEAYPTNYSKHALGLQQFICSDEIDSKLEKRTLLQDGIDTLESIEGSSSFEDAYPLTTLAKGHVSVLLRMGEIDEARNVAYSYRQRLNSLQKKKPNDARIRELLTQLLIVQSTNEFNSDYWMKFDHAN